MIGQLINEFDELFDPTLADFNSTFKMDLEGDLKASVKIGTMVVGGLREVLIDGKIELIELPTIVDRGDKNIYKVYKVMTKGNVIYTTHLLKNVSEMLQTERRKVAQYCDQGRDLYGHRIDKVRVTREEYLKSKENKIPSEYEVDKSVKCDKLKLGRSSSYYYEYTKNGEKTTFNDMKSFVEATGISRKTIEARVRNNVGLFSGWKVERFNTGE